MDVDLVETFNFGRGSTCASSDRVEDGGREYLLLTGEFDGRDSLVVWRDVDNLDPEREKCAVLETACSERFGRSLDSFHVVLHNADAALPGGESLISSSSTQCAEFRPMADFFEGLALATYITDLLGGNYSRLLADVKAHHNRSRIPRMMA